MSKIVIYVFVALFAFTVEAEAQDLLWFDAGFVTSAPLRDTGELGSELEDMGFGYTGSEMMCDVLGSLYTHRHWNGENQLIITFRGLKAFGLFFTSEEAFNIQKGRLLQGGFVNFDEYEYERVALNDCFTNASTSEDSNTITIGALKYRNVIATLERIDDDYFIGIIHKDLYNFD